MSGRDKKAAEKHQEAENIKNNEAHRKHLHDDKQQDRDHHEDIHEAHEEKVHEEDRDKKESHLTKKELLAKIENAEKENTGLSDRLLRTLAEFDNYKKRVTREKEELIKYGIERFALELLPVLDNFERACEQIQKAKEIDKVVAGVEMILKQLRDTLEKFQVKTFSSVGEPFDPEKHEAMAQQEHDTFAANTVTAEFQKGYYLSDKLLRPARVIVSKGTPEEGTEA